LIKNDPIHAEQYAHNVQLLKERIKTLDQELQSTLHPVQQYPFLVYHDGYQYFEKSYGLNGAGTLIINPNVPLSAKGLYDIHQLIDKKHIICVFTETEFRNVKLAKVLQNPDMHVIELDPLGARQPADNHAYEDTLRALGNDVRKCWRTE
jgi:zinc transport system substrate-binding protein